MKGCFIAGADPELMIKTDEGALTSAIGLVPGTKKRPRKVSGGAIQHDNVMAEFNVNPADSSEELVGNMRSVLKELSAIVSPNVLVVQASAEFPDRELRHQKARIFGCDPDFDSWTLSMNQIDARATMSNFRSAGGHFHIGKRPETAQMLDDPYGKVEVVKMLDVFLGIPSVLLDPDPTAPARRRLYGKAGAHRPKPYGVEYRALGNFWVRSPELAELIYALADTAVKLTQSGESQGIIESIGVQKVQDVVNESKPKLAASIIDRVLSRFLPKDLTESILSQQPTKAVEGVGLKEAWGF